MALMDQYLRQPTRRGFSTLPVMPNPGMRLPTIPFPGGFRPVNPGYGTVDPRTGVPLPERRGGSYLPAPGEEGRSGTMPVQPFPGSSTMPIQPFPGSSTMPVPQRPGIPGPTPIPQPPFPQPPGPTPFPQQPPVPGNVVQPFINRNNNPWLNAYNAGASRATGPGDYDSELSRQAGELDPQAEFQRLLNAGGMAGQDRRSQFAQGQFGNFDKAFRAQQLRDTDLSLRDFIGRSGGVDVLRNQWLDQTAQQRGLNPSSRTSTIRWG